MGADNFSTQAEGASATEAFQNAVKQAQYDHGHSGYSGTIAEKSEFTLIPDSEWKGKYDPAWYARKLMEDDDARITDKWGPAGAIQLEEGKWLFFGWASS